MARGKRGAEGDPELDLVPIMNMVTILIPFLLLSVQFVSIAVIDSTLPAIGKPTEATEEPDEEKLNLSVLITGKGYTIAGANAVLGDGDGPGIPCLRDGCPSLEAYDTKTLTEKLGQIKDQFEKEENVILVPDANIPYEVLIATMDATREDPDTKVDDKPRTLFPFVVIAGGVN